MFQVEKSPQELSFGRQGESNILSYAFDFSEWAADWPGGLASMTVILPNQTQPQPIPDTQAIVDGTIITLHVLDNLTEKDGRGTLIIRYVAGQNKKRSRMIEFVVEKGHETQAGSGISVVDDWIDEATRTLNDVKSLTFTINEDGELLAGETILGRVSDNPRGDYTPSADPLYSKRDIVFDNGGSYRYINDTPSNEPTSSTSHWQQIAEKGDKGDQGIQGVKGDPGDISNIKVDGATKTKAAGVVDLTSDFARYALWCKTASGNPVSVYPVPESPLYPKVSGTFTQAGTGDPSPSNIRPITPWLASGGTVNIAQTDGSAITLTAPQEITVGWMDNEGKGQVTWGKKVFDGTETTWATTVGGGSIRYFDFALVPGSTASGHLCYCSHAKYIEAAYNQPSSNPASLNDVCSMTLSGGSFRYNKQSISTVNEFKAYLAAQYAAGTPVTIYYPLAAPVSITPAAAPLTALPQLDRVTPRTNVMTASTGNVELTYAKSPIRESDEIATAIAAL